MTLATEFITLNDGTKICAPADIRLMTHFVLKEQGDWFENEIHFVRNFVAEGMNALDIGANYGLYSTAIANRLGKDGKLWCFEPTPNTADALEQTIAENKLDKQVEIIQSGLSDKEGEASFYMSPNAELNSLTPEPGMEEVTINLRTLDECAETYKWPQIDFIKLDAEGEEVNILNGGKAFFEAQSPLVMFELKHKESINMPLIDAFKDLGFSIYHLVPGLNVLAPFDSTDHIDGFLLNLFAVKEDKVADLLEQGVLVNMPDLASVTKVDAIPDAVTGLPCFSDLKIDFGQATSLDAEYQEILMACAASRDDSLTVQARFDQLAKALELTKVALKGGQKPRPERLSTLARIAYDSGHQGVGNQILMFLFERFIKPSKVFGLAEPFVPISAQFESVVTGGKPDMWFCSMILDQIARKQSFSAIFSGAPETLKFVEVMEQLGFVLPDMLRRREAIQTLMSTQQN